MTSPDPGGSWYRNPWGGIIGLLVLVLLLWLIFHFFL